LNNRAGGRCQVGIGTDTPNRELTVSETDGSSDAFLNVAAPNRELLIGVNQSSGAINSTPTNNDLVVDGDIRKDYGGTGLG